jgi:general stress protein 26|nr:hypothetical protein [Phenylobacterium sp.]
MGIETGRGDAAPAKLWEAIETRRIGMLGMPGSGLHAQPMIARVERRRKQLWFIARSDTDLVRSIGEAGACMFVVQDGDFLASVSGALSVVHDRKRIARYWTAEVAAWLPGGADDPRLVLLRMDCVDAEVWIAELGMTKFTWESARTGGLRKIVEADGWPDVTFH